MGFFPAQQERRISALNAGAAAVMLLCVLTHCANAEAPNDGVHYLRFDNPANINGGFEEQEGTEGPAGWELTGAAAFQWALSGKARTGNAAMQLPLRGPLEQTSGAHLFSAPFSAQPGDALKFNAWFRCEGDPAAVPTIRMEALTDEGWRAIAPWPQLKTPPSADWFPLGMSVVMPLNAQRARIAISLFNSEPSAATWYLDDAQCQVISLRRYVDKHRTDERLKDLLLLGTDTLRQSPLGCYGATNSHTPNMDQIAREGIVYRHTLATSMWTRPSFASIFTSLYPSQHTAELHNSALPESVLTMAELFKAKGYFTVGFALTPFDGFLGPGAGFAQGFDVFFHSDDVETVSRLTREYLDANAEAFSAIEGGGLFLFRHIWDPHAPYRNHYPDMIVNQGLLRADKTIDVRHALQGYVLWEKLYPQRPGIANTLDIEYAKNLYYSEAWHTDRLIGELFTRLRFYGLYENMNIVLCSDHGESFNEPQGVWNHGHPYNTCAEVPLIVRVPGRIAPGSRNDTDLVTNLDIMPTLLTVAGIAAPPGLEGRCLLSADLNASKYWGIAEDRKCGSLIIRDARHKLIVIPASLPVSEEEDPYQLWLNLQPGFAQRAATNTQLASDRVWVFAAPDSPSRFELYDLEADPQENNNLAGEAPEKVHALLMPLLAHCLRTGITSLDELRQENKLALSGEDIAALESSLRDEAQAGIHQPEFLDMDPDTIETLKALGYLQ